MTQFDIIYKDLVNKIINEGHLSSGNVRTKYLDGTPAHYKSYIGYQFRLDNSTDEALVITSRRAPWKSAIRELEWIWVRQSNDVNELEQMGCKFWSEFGVKEIDNRKIIYVEPKIINEIQYENKLINEIINPNLPIETSKDFGEYYILEYFKNENGIDMKKIQFKNTGYIKSVSKYKKNPRDPYVPSVFGIGYYGECNSEEIKEYFGEHHRKWIKKWENIVRRCTGNADRQKWYNDVVLGNSFRCCEYFLKWVMNNNKWGKDMLNNLDVDKDYYLSNCYSEDTCVLIPHQANIYLTNDEWFKYDNYYFFSKIELGKYLYKNKNINVISGNNDSRIDLRKVDRFIKFALNNNNLEIIVNNYNENGLIPRFLLEPKNTILHAYGRALKTKTYGFESQVHYILNEIKNNPNSRRIITEIWLPEQLDNMSLNPCVHLTQWTVIDNKLYLEVRQRSCDVALGLTANVWQYSILHKLIAHECGLEPAELIWTIHNVHIYDRHIEKIQKQIQNITDVKPKVTIEYPNDFFEFKSDMIKLENYNITNDIKYDLAV